MNSDISLYLGLALVLVAAAASSLPRLSEAFEASTGSIGKAKLQTKKTVDIIISRYKEDLNWLNSYKDKEFRKIIIYNKGSPEFKPPFQADNLEIINLINVGVCDHTYLNHIVTKYDDLADITLFLPGSADLSNKYVRLHEVIIRACDQGLPTMFVYNVENVKNFQLNFEIATHRVACSKNIDNNESYKLARASPRPFGKWYDYYFPGKTCPYITYTGIFSLSRSTIQKNGVAFYNKFLEQLKHDKFPEAAHYVERAWPSFFHPQPKEEIKDYIN